MAFLDNIGLTKLIQLIKGSLPTKATSSTLGLVKPDNSTITVDSDGVISSSGGGSSYTLPTASTSTLGGVKIDNNTIKINSSGVISFGQTNRLLTKGSGSDSFATCNGSPPSSSFSFAIGDGCQAYENYGFATGKYTQSTEYGVAMGKYNVIDDYNNFRLIIGNGTSFGSRADIYAVDVNGNQYLTGNIYVGCNDYTTTSNGPTTEGCGGQKVFYGSLVSADTAPTVDGAINWVYG